VRGLENRLKAASRLSAQHWCPSLVLAPSLNTMLPNIIGHSAQERALLLEVVLNNGTSCAQHVLGTILNIGHQCRALRLSLIPILILS
jgi:hypothetical protein